MIVLIEFQSGVILFLTNNHYLDKMIEKKKNDKNTYIVKKRKKRCDLSLPTEDKNQLSIL